MLFRSRYVINAASEVVVGKWIPPDGIHRSLPFDRKRLLREFFCNHLICWKTEDYLEVKGMREDLMWAEDWDLALRMARRFTFQNIPDPLYYVREYEGARLTRQVDEEKKADIVREVLCAAQTAEILDHRHPAELHMSYVKALRKTTRNVLLINNEVDLYGGELCLLDLARSLQGYRPVVILPRKGPLQALLEKALAMATDFEAGCP